jgi:hypothetical protein
MGGGGHPEAHQHPDLGHQEQDGHALEEARLAPAERHGQPGRVGQPAGRRRRQHPGRLDRGAQVVGQRPGATDRPGAGADPPAGHAERHLEQAGQELLRLLLGERSIGLRVGVIEQLVVERRHALELRIHHGRLAERVDVDLVADRVLVAHWSISSPIGYWSLIGRLAGEG